MQLNIFAGNYKKKIQSLVESSRQVINDCVFPNGAIIAADSAKPYYSKESKNYKFVWPRDGAFVCMAAEILGMDIQNNFLHWCLKAEGWNSTGLLYEKYYINGTKARFNFQPDQTGIVLHVASQYFKKYQGGIKRNLETLIQKTADGLCKIWKEDHFDHLSQDIWEERFCFPDKKENFSYALAACARGLISANEVFPNEKWMEAAGQMTQVLLNSSSDYFYRSFGEMEDKNIDASMVGLVWPFQVVAPKERKMLRTIKLIEEKLAKNYEVYRYEHDRYDGWVFQQNISRNKGAGFWPLLNFWMSIYYVEKGDKGKADKFFLRVLDKLDTDYIPEQIFENDQQVAVSPLCWSHAMFIIAAEKLGYIQKP